MKKCVFLTMDSLQDFECYDHLTFTHLENSGWSVEEISWHKTKVNWNDYDLVIIRSPWDYQNDAEGFLRVLDKIEASTATLANPVEIVRWNINKRYLLTLENKGINIVPTVFKDSINVAQLVEYFEHFSVDELILKPSVSANADDTFRLSLKDLKKQTSKLNALFVHRDCMIQPFMDSVISEGEYSLFYFNGALSHAILKVPATNDFRVQEEHGGSLKSIVPEQQLKECGDLVLDAIEGELLYARFDFVRSKSDFFLMEAELIEPSLYFNLDENSARRFTEAVTDYMA